MFSDPQFWILVSFIIFVLAIFRPVKKILLSSLDDKINEIKQTIEQAEIVKNDAQKTLSNLKKKQNEVKIEIQKMKEDNKSKITDIKNNAKNKIEEQIRKKNELAELRIAQMLREANNQIQEIITQASIDASLEIFNKNLDQNSKQKLIDQSISELNLIYKN